MEKEKCQQELLKMFKNLRFDGGGGRRRQFGGLRPPDGYEKVAIFQIDFPVAAPYNEVVLARTINFER